MSGMPFGQLTAVSLFAGVGGMDLACEAAGIKVLATAEIDKHAHALLKRKWPSKHHYTDVKDVTRDGLLRDVGAVPDLVIGGFPCQDLSVAGQQAGLAGARSGLFWEHLRIARECESRYVIFENVPGLLSSNGGRDMGTVLGALAESGYGFAYRVLDAQYFGVPQRRRRVFIVGHLGGDGSAPSEVLALLEGRSGDLAPSRSTRTEPAGAAEHGAAGLGATRDVVSSLTSSMRFGADDNTAQAGHLVAAPVVAATLTRGGAASPGVNPSGRRQEDDTNLVVTSVAGQITHTLTSEGADASEDGTGRGTPIVTYRKSKRAQTDQDDETWVEDGKTNTLNLFDTGDTRATTLIVPTEPLAFMWQAGGNNSSSGAHEYDMTPTLPKSQTIAVQTVDRAVRRLTPLECERLQGFPDGWTEGQADSHRYRQMGNAVAVPCVAWFLQRLAHIARKELAA
jgi:DNA (cytosine-5)-methyltransferase 1